MKTHIIIPGLIPYIKSSEDSEERGKMAFVGIVLETCASDEPIVDLFKFMLEMANRYQMPVKANINQVDMVIEPFKGNVEELYMRIYLSKLHSG